MEDRPAELVAQPVADNRAGWHDQPPQTHMTQEEEHILAELDTLRMQRDRAGLEALAAESWSSLVDERAFYRTGRALLELGATDPARRFLDQAELVMARPNRSNNELREVVREVAADHGVPLCDLAAQLDRYAEHGIAGNDLFADACHPNALGHALMAQILAGCAQQAGLFPDGLPADPRWEEPLPVDPLRLDHDARRLDAEPLGAVDTAPELADAIQAGHQAFSAQRYDQAWAHYARALDAGGAPGALLSNQALVRWHQGRMDDVETILEQALEAAPEDEELRNWSGLLTR